MYSCLKRWASSLASCMTRRARSVKRAYIRGPSRASEASLLIGQENALVFDRKKVHPANAWGRARTPKGFPSTAQGRVAHPGRRATPCRQPQRGCTPAKRPLGDPFGVVVILCPIPGCAPRPWAVEGNPFGVGNLSAHEKRGISCDHGDATKKAHSALRLVALSGLRGDTSLVPARPASTSAAAASKTAPAARRRRRPALARLRAGRR